MKKIKNTFLIAVLLTASATATVTAQVTIGANTSPQPFSALELISGGDKGLRLPQMSNADKTAAFGADNAVLTAAGTVAQGLQIFNTTICCVETWNGAMWIQTCSDCECSVTDIEGHVYKSASFGAAGCWMTESLATTKYPDGTNIPQKNNTNTNNSPYYWIPNKTPSATALTATEINNAYTNRVGLLYTWAAAVYGRDYTANVSEPNSSGQPVYQGVCPAGWHLPSDYEFNQLEKEIVANYSQYSDMSSAPSVWQSTWETGTGYRPSSGSGHGQAMKSKSSPVGNSDVTNGLSKTSDLGFNGLLVGNARGDVTSSYGSFTDYWSSSSNDSSHAWYRLLNSGNTGVLRDAPFKYFLFSVRCKKNE